MTKINKLVSVYIPQQQLDNLTRLLSPNKVVVIYGPRRCGKTTEGLACNL